MNNIITKRWSEIRKINCKGINIDKSISADMWYNHFNLLLNNSPNIDNNFEETVNNFISQHDSRCDTCTINEPNILNVDIELDEINVVIKV